MTPDPGRFGFLPQQPPAQPCAGGVARTLAQPATPGKWRTPPLPAAPPIAPPAMLAGATGSATPMGPAELLLIREATVRRKTIKKAARTASVSGVTTLVIGGLAVLWLVFSHGWLDVVVSVGLCVIGFVEYKGAERLRQADPAATTLLARNQLALLGLIAFYCVVQMLTFSPEAWKAAAVSPEFRNQLNNMPDMTRSIDAQIDRWAPLAIYGFYGLVLLASIACQGGMALYYRSRRKHVQAYIEQTPAWVRQVLAETGA